VMMVQLLLGANAMEKLLVWMFLASVSTALCAVSISGPRVICGQTDIVLSAPAGMIRYSWNTGSTDRQITVTSAGTYTCTVTLPNGNIDTGVAVVRQAFIPHPSIGNPVEYLCAGDQLRLEAPTTFVSYRWNTGDTTSSIRVTQEGRFRLTVVDTNGCTGTSDEILVLVIPKPVVSIQGPTSVCKDGTLVHYVSGQYNTSYTWTADGGVVESGQGSPAVKVRWSRSGSLTVRAVTTRPDGGVCTKDTTIKVNVLASVKPTISYTRRDICTGDSVQLTAVAGGNVVWNTGDTTQTITVRNGGYYYVTVAGVDGCSGVSDTVEVIEFQKPQITITGPRVLCPGSSAVLTASDTRGDVVRWVWNTGEQGSSIRITAPGTYSVIGTTLDACSETTSITLGVQPPITMSVPDVNVGVVPTGLYAQPVVQVANNGVNDVSVISVQSSSPVTVKPLTPRLVGAGTRQNFTVQYLPLVPGAFSITLRWVLMDSECQDTITSRITGIAVGDTITGEVSIFIPDTTVPVGTYLNIPIRLQSTLHFNGSTTVRFTVRTPRNALNVLGSGGCSIERVAQEATDNVYHILIAGYPSGQVDTTVYLNVQTMLRKPERAPVTADSVTLENGVVPLATYHNGSVAITGCWIEGRLVTFQQLHATLVVYQLNGQQVYRQTFNITPEEIRGIVNKLGSSGTPFLAAVYLADGTYYWSSFIVAQ